jgi:hypothetical protein
VNDRNAEDLELFKLANDKDWRRCPGCSLFVERKEGMCTELSPFLILNFKRSSGFMWIALLKETFHLYLVQDAIISNAFAVAIFATSAGLITNRLSQGRRTRMVCHPASVRCLMFQPRLINQLLHGGQGCQVVLRLEFLVASTSGISADFPTGWCDFG